MTALVESPERTAEPVSAVLASCDHPQIRRLVCRESDDEVELSGRVASYYLKQVAQETIREAVAGRRLLNRVIVA
jgi:hypothetical protein